MKKFISCFLILVAPAIIFGQCTIYMKNGDKIPAKSFFAPIKSDQLTYKSADKQKLSVNKKDVFALTRKKQFYVLNENGMLVGGTTFKGMPAPDAKSPCLDGAVDALNSYRVGGTPIATGVVSLLVWPVGILTTAIVTSVPPAQERLNVPASGDKNNKTYMDCYKKEARKKKNQAAWMGCSLGTCWGIAITSLILIL